MSLVKRMRVRSWYVKEIMTFACMGGIFLLFLALFSYCASDSSFFYVTLGNKHVANFCGALGAHVAGFLFYLCGPAAWVLVSFFVLFFYWFLWQHKLWSDHWERVVACLGLVCLMDLFCAVEDTTFFNAPHVGCIGLLLSRLLQRFFNEQEMVVVLYLLSLCCMVLLLRFSGMRFILNALYQLFHGAAMLFKQLVLQRVMVTSKKYWSRCITSVGRMGDVAKRGAIWFCSVDNVVAVPDDYESIQQELADLFGKSNEHHNNLFHQQPVAKQDYDRGVFSDAHQVVKSAKKAPKRTAVSNASGYQCPPREMFAPVVASAMATVDLQELRERAQVLEDKLEKFSVYGSIVSIKSGPVVALFEYQPRIDIKLSKILALEDDLALALQALSIRIIAPIPGTSVVGFEVAHKKRVDVPFSGLVRSAAFADCADFLPIVLGQDTVGMQVIVDLARMPHLLMAGSTGSGKSVALNCILMSLLCKFRPDELNLVLIDPKRLEFASYADLAHLLFPVVTDPKKVAPVLRWVIGAMEERYELMAVGGVRNIHDYNMSVDARAGRPTLPFIVVIIDELADLMITTGREIEDLIARIAQMARAAGIHLIVATQRPSVDVITGLIKVNFPSRISFRVASKVDSRIILDEVGADKLLGRGDMLFLDSAGLMRRVHGAYVTDAQIEQVCSHIKRQQPPQYQSLAIEQPNSNDELSVEDEELYQQVLVFLQGVDEVSISLLQRKFRIGYNRSARVIEMLEERGSIMPSDGGKPRKIIR